MVYLQTCQLRLKFMRRSQHYSLSFERHKSITTRDMFKLELLWYLMSLQLMYVVMGRGTPDINRPVLVTCNERNGLGVKTDSFS